MYTRARRGDEYTARESSKKRQIIQPKNRNSLSQESSRKSKNIDADLEHKMIARFAMPPMTKLAQLAKEVFLSLMLLRGHSFDIVCVHRRCP